MKKYLSFALAIIGIASALFISTVIIRFGTANMRRTNDEAIRYKMAWADRR